MNPVIKKVLGESLDYVISIRPKLDEARQRAAESATDPSIKQFILKGHGKYVGSCGHTIQQCRCPSNLHPGRIQVEAVCERCSGQ
jgi:hypothetical protein